MTIRVCDAKIRVNFFCLALATFGFGRSEQESQQTISFEKHVVGELHKNDM